MGRSPEERLYLPDGWEFEVTYKPIRNIWFRADSRRRVVRISAPRGTSSADLNRAIGAKVGWLALKASQDMVPLLIPLRVTHGDTCLYLGRTWPVSVTPHSQENQVEFCPDSGVAIRMKQVDDPEGAARILSQWYRRLLEAQIPPLLLKWEPMLGVEAREWRIRKMKTRWGSCNIRAKRIWINLALAGLSHDLLEYVLVHELLHLLEPSHNLRFYSLMEKAMPDWQARKKRLSGHGPGLA